MTYKKFIEDKRDKSKRIRGQREIIRFNDGEKQDFYQNEYPNMCPNDKYVPAIIPSVSRIIVFGDIHGDYNLMIEMLTSAKLIQIQNNKITWIGGSTYVVQVGDQVDRCRPMHQMQCNNKMTTPNDEASDIKILELFNDLHHQAIKQGGAVISLLGNHELMNATGQMNYVSYEGLKEFDNYYEDGKRFAKGIDGRKYAFEPGHKYGKLLGCSRLPAVIIGSNLFVHAGIIDNLIKEIDLRGISDFEDINITVRKWLLGLLDYSYVKDIVNGSKNSMFWTRILGSIPANTPIDHPICANNISNVLKLFNVNGIIVGHTPQSFINSDDINGTCSGKVWRVDNGSSAAFNKFDPTYTSTGERAYSRRVQYLEIIDDKIYRICDGRICK